MGDNIGFVYDKCGFFWDDGYTPMQLKKMDDLNHPDIGYIRQNLYSEKKKTEEERIVFVNTNKPFFRRWNISDAERNGFSSVCETKLHRACKLGIANAKQIRVKIGGKDYILCKKWSDVETTYQLLGNKYETDCEYAISNIDNDLKEKIGGDVLCFEVHHSSKVNPKKMMAYKISGINMLEFDIQTRYLPYYVKNEQIDEDKMIQYFTNYYENVDKHYISGTFYPPVVTKIQWDGGMTKVYDVKNGKEIEVKIYKDRFSPKKCYNIIFICEDQKYTQFNYDGKKIEDFSDAKKYATYLIEMHIQGKMSIAFK